MKKIRDINHAHEFENAIVATDKVIVVDLWAPWCGPCRVLHPVLREVAQGANDATDFIMVNVDDFPDIAQAHDVRAIPTLLYFRDGKVVDRTVGVLSAQQLREKLTAFHAA